MTDNLAHDIAQHLGNFPIYPSSTDTIANITAMKATDTAELIAKVFGSDKHCKEFLYIAQDQIAVMSPALLTPRANAFFQDLITTNHDKEGPKNPIVRALSEIVLIRHLQANICTAILAINPSSTLSILDAVHAAYSDLVQNKSKGFEQSLNNVRNDLIEMLKEPRHDA